MVIQIIIHVLVVRQVSFLLNKETLQHWTLAGIIVKYKEMEDDLFFLEAIEKDGSLKQENTCRWEEKPSILGLYIPAGSILR